MPCLGGLATCRQGGRWAVPCLGGLATCMLLTSRWDSFRGASRTAPRPPCGTSVSGPPCTGRTVTPLGFRLRTYAGTHPPSSGLGSQTQSDVSVCLSSAVWSSSGLSHDTSSVATLW